MGVKFFYLFREIALAHRTVAEDGFPHGVRISNEARPPHRGIGMDRQTDFGGQLSVVRWFTASLVLIANRFPSVVQFSWRQ